MTKINPKWTINLNVKCKTEKLSGKYRGVSLECRAKQRVQRLDTKSTIHKRKTGQVRPNQNFGLLLCESP
jgi:hypothetical protein